MTNPTIKDLVVDVASNFLMKDIQQTYNLNEFAEKMDLQQVFDQLPSINTEHLDANFLKSLFAFKGTFKDLMYLLKLSGIDLEIDEHEEILLSYGDNLTYSDSTNNIYGPISNGIDFCNIGVNSYVNIDTYQDIVDIELIKDVLKKIIENRLYFCTVVQYIKIQLLYKDNYNYQVSEKLNIQKNIDDTDNLIFVYGENFVYGKTYNYGYGIISKDDSLIFEITRNIHFIYGRNITYGDPVIDRDYNISFNAKYGDEILTYTETIEA